MTEQAPAAEGQVASAAPEAQGQAGEAPAWYNEAPDEVKGYIQNKGWDTPIKAVTSYQELEKFRGASEDQLLKLPKDFDAEGALDPIYDKLGRPESADKYSVEFPDGMPVDENRLNLAREAAHKAGLNNKQFEALVKMDMEYNQSVITAMQEESAQKQEAEYQALQKEWGSNAAEREELARRGLAQMLPSGDKKALAAAIEDAIGTAATLKLFANVGEKLGREDKIHDSGGDRPFGYTREQAAADKAALMSEVSADPSRLANYNKGKGPDYDKMQRLIKIGA